MKKIQKIIFTLIYTFLVMTAGFAADFTWNGSNSSAWNASSNWTLSKPDIIDINMGCPVSKVAIKSQAGSALLKIQIRFMKL